MVTFVMPRTADAFVGESLVINPATKTLTEAAKTVLTKPTFLPENIGEAALAGGVDEAGAAAGVAEGAGLLPSLGPGLLALGAGVGVGSAICHVLGIEGCWLFKETESYTAPGKSWTWEFFIPAFNPSGRPFTYIGKFVSLYYVPLVGYSTGKCEHQAVPAQATRVNPEPVFTPFYCKVGAEKVGENEYAVERSPMQGRSFTWSSGNGGLTEYKPGGKDYEPPSEWPQKFAKAIEGKTGNPAAHVGEKIASQIKGSEVANPYASVKVPDCTGLLWLPCKKELEELNLVPERFELGWETAVLTKPADSVVEVAGAGNKVVPTTKVKVITNPDEFGMPLVIPQPETGETYSHYAARLNPGLSPTRHDLEAPFIDPTTGPNGVVSVEPKAETRLNPATEHEVKVSTNPADAPVPVAGWVPPGIPAIDMGPLSGIPSPCSVFPFGLLCWVGEAFAQFNTSGVCPNVAVPVAKTTFDITLCGETTETIMGYLRPAMLLAFIVGCGFLFARATKAVGGD
jgi:hypothetical protein